VFQIWTYSLLLVWSLDTEDCRLLGFHCRICLQIQWLMNFRCSLFMHSLAWPLKLVLSVCPLTALGIVWEKLQLYIQIWNSAFPHFATWKTKDYRTFFYNSLVFVFMHYINTVWSVHLDHRRLIILAVQTEVWRPPPLDPALSKLNPIYTSISYFSEMYFNIILPFMPR